MEIKVKKQFPMFILAIFLAKIDHSLLVGKLVHKREQMYSSFS